MKRNSSSPGWFGRHKKATIILSVILILLVAGIFWVRRQMQTAMDVLAEVSQTTAVAEYRDVSSTITASGKVASAHSRRLTADLTGAKITQVGVEVGDLVAPGDVICVFDVADIRDSLADAESGREAAEAQGRLSVDGARRGLADAETARDYQLSNARDAMDQAWEAYLEADSDRLEAERDLADLEDDEEEARRERDDTQDDYDSVAGAYEEAYGRFSSLALDIQALQTQLTLLDPLAEAETIANINTHIADLTISMNQAQAQYLSLQYDYQTFGAAYKAAEAAYAQASAAREAQEKLADSYEAAADKTYDAYQSAVKTYNYTLSSTDSAVEAARRAVESARISVDTSLLSSNSTVRTYARRLEDGSLVSTVAGTVTAVYAKAGDTYTGSVLAVVEEVDSLVIEAEIDEYYIADVAEGMAVLFKTDSTGDRQLNGVVSSVALTPTETMGGGDVTYTVSIDITSFTERLRIGMTARLNIITSQVNDVLTVPYDSVQTAEDGSRYVTVVEAGEDGQSQYTDVTVTLGVEGDYYVEISSGLTAGQTVLIPREDGFDLMSLMMDYSTF